MTTPELWKTLVEDVVDELHGSSSPDLRRSTSLLRRALAGEPPEALITRAGALIVSALAAHDGPDWMLTACGRLIDAEQELSASSARPPLELPSERTTLRGEEALLQHLATQGHLRHVRVLRTRVPWSLAGIDMTGSHWMDSDLSGQSLRGVRFDGARLQDVDLSGCDLRGASFVDAELQRVSLRGTQATGVDLSRARVEVIDVTGANLTGVAFVGARFVEADLRQARVERARLERCLLVDAQAAEVDFSGCDLTDATLRGADLTKAKLDGVVARQIDLRGADLSNASLRDCLLYTSPSPRDQRGSRMPSSA